VDERAIGQATCIERPRLFKEQSSRRDRRPSSFNKAYKFVVP
jgi:hypothetical protein